MKLCVVGASGKLGQYMVQHALDRGYEVVGVCRAQRVKNSIGSRHASL
jgi:putative NADH-flavin reductase